MLLRCVLFWLVSNITSFVFTSVVCAQDYPNKAVRIITGSSGSGGDFVTRVVVQGFPAALGQPAIIDNRGGVASGLGVAKAPPDGYTLLLQSSTLWIGTLLRETAYDPVKDFFPITLVVKSPNVLIVHPSVPVSSVKELISLAKTKPNALNYSSGSAGGSSHLAAELFKAMAGVQIVRVTYKNSALQMADLIGGYVQLTFDSGSLLMSHVKSGRLKALAVTSAEPSTLIPGLPTIAATVPGYESAGMFGLFAPAGTPAAIISRLHQAAVRILNEPDIKEKFIHSGMETIGNSPGQFAAAIKSEMSRLGTVIKNAGITAE